MPYYNRIICKYISIEIYTSTTYICPAGENYIFGNMTDALHTYLNTCISNFYRDRVPYNFFLFEVVNL